VAQLAEPLRSSRERVQWQQKCHSKMWGGRFTEKKCLRKMGKEGDGWMFGAGGKEFRVDSGKCPEKGSHRRRCPVYQKNHCSDSDARALCLPRFASLCVRLSVRPSVRHTRVPRLYSSRRRNTFRTVRSSDGSGFLSLNFVVPSLGDHHEREC